MEKNMKIMTIVTAIIALVFLTGCMQTKRELVASKCRLKLPIIKAQCEEAGVYNTFGGRMEGLPVTTMRLNGEL